MHFKTNTPMLPCSNTPSRWIDVAWGTLLGSALAGEVLVYAECSRWYLHVCFSNPRVVAGLAAAQDRKSTRLNSSHVAISYAVFCLKKKREKAVSKLSSAG